MKLIAQKLLTLIAVLSVSVNALAYDFEVDGIYYNILSVQDKTVKVTYKEYSNGTYKSDYSGDVVIPEQVQYNEELYRVTSIGNCAFYYCSSLASVTISESVTSIDYSAFSGCSSLASVTIPESVTSIGDSAFSGCSSLASVTIPEGVTSIGGSAFSGCSSLASVTIPESVTSIGNNAFYCRSLKELRISNLSSYLKIKFENEGSYPNRESVYSIDVIVDGEKLTDLVIPEGISDIGDFWFRGWNLNSVTIPEGVKKIGDYAFTGCGLKEMLELPSLIESIGSHAFDDTFPICRIEAQTPPSIVSDSFLGLSVLIVPNGCSGAYKAACGDTGKAMSLTN